MNSEQATAHVVRLLEEIGIHVALLMSSPFKYG